MSAWVVTVATDNAEMKSLRLCGLVIFALVACSPALNWRTVQVQGAPLQVLLPCDPQTAARPIEMGLGTVQLNMLGCDADHATYAISHFLIKDPSSAAQALSYWQAAVLNQLKTSEGAGSADAAKLMQAKGDGAFVPKGALNLPQSIRTTFEGMGPKGWKLTGHGVWFARIEGDGARLYHAVIYGDKPHPNEADTFFAGLQTQ